MAGLAHKEDVPLSKAEAEEHHQVALLIDHTDSKADDKVPPIARRGLSTVASL